MADDADKTVPMTRFRAVNQKLADTAKLLETTQAELKEAQKAAGGSSTAATELAALKQQLAAKEAAWAEERALLAGGITDAEDADLLRFHYQRVPEAERPASIADYIAGLKAKDAAVPKGLSHLFQPAANPATKVDPAANGVVVQPGKVEVRPASGNAGAGGAPPTGGMTEEQAAAYFRSPAYTSLTREQRKAKAMEVNQQLVSATQAAV